MKLSVSLSGEDVGFLDAYAQDHGIGSRSATLQRAVQLLRDVQLEQAYADAWDEWERSGDADAWAPSTADGLDR